MYIGCTAQSAPAMNGRRKKLPSLHEPDAQQGREHNILPWYHLGLPHPHRHSLDAAAVFTAYSRTL